MPISDSFQVFLSQAPSQAQAWMNAVRCLDQASALDKKTEDLAYIAILSSARLTSGIPFHVESAKKMVRRVKKLLAQFYLASQRWAM